MFAEEAGWRGSSFPDLGKVEMAASPRMGVEGRAEFELNLSSFEHVRKQKGNGLTEFPTLALQHENSRSQ